ncbi:MAG: MFS transporter [Planctomycetes bacterium]|nr:MFS transporter [Planctomycetota bacterium]
MENTITGTRFLGINLAEGVRRRNLLAVIAVVFLGMFSLFLLIAIFQKFLMTRCIIPKNVIPRNVGYFMALQNIAYFIAAPLWGRLSDKYGRRRIAVFCFMFSALVFAFVGLTQSFWEMFAAKVFMGFFIAGAVSTAMAASADYCQMRDRAKIMGLMGTVIGTGAVIGIPAGAILFKIHFYLPFFVQAFLYIVCAVLCIAFFKPGLASAGAMPGHGHGHPGAGGPPPQKGGNKILELLKIPKLQISYASAFLYGGGMQLSMVVFMPWGELTAGLSSKKLSIYLAISGLVFTILVAFAGWLSQKFGNMRMIMFGLFGLCVNYLILAFVDNTAIVVWGYVLTSIFSASIYPNALALAVNSVPPYNRGVSMGCYHSLRSIGEIIFSLIIGAVMVYYGKRGGFAIPAAVAGLIGLYTLYMVMAERNQHKVVSSE